jgi:hypothetical protein
MKKFHKNPLYELHWILLITKWHILTHTTPHKNKNKKTNKHTCSYAGYEEEGLMRL